MASKIGILIVAFLSYITLASGFFFGFPGFFDDGPGHNFLYPDTNANDRVFEGSAQQQRSNNGDGSIFPLGSGFNDQPSQSNEPAYGHAHEKHKPVKIPEPRPELVHVPDHEPAYGHAHEEHKPVKIPEPRPELVQVPDHKPVQEPTPNPGHEGEPEPRPKPELVQGPDPMPVQEPSPNTGHEPEPEPKPMQESNPKPVQEPGKGGLRVNFYEQSCPQAENIVNETIHKHFKKDPTYAAGFVRLFFHDCYVTGCDASIFLDTTPTGEEVEKKARHNGPFVRGYEVVDDIKTQLEAACPGIVSCADILAFATRDSLVYTGVPVYPVEGGRRDSRASLAKNVEGNLPLPDASAEDNVRLFEKKGMSLEDLVVLVGAHSIGSAHCSIVTKRFRDKEKAKEIDRGYWLKMQTMTACVSEHQEVPFDPYSQHKMDSRFYKELLTNKALIESDHNLARDPRGNNVMKKLVDDQVGWLAKFTNAMKKLGETEVLVGDQGEIRKQCRAVN